MSLEELLAGESQYVEYKLQRSESSKSYVKTAVAFANARGGSIVFGIDDKTHEVIGVPDDKIFDDMDAIANTLMDSITPAIIPNISIQHLRGKSLIVVDVPLGKQCPFYLTSKGLQNGVYVRVGATTRQADAEWVHNLTVESSEQGYDRTICRGRSVSPQEIEALCNSMYHTAMSRCLTPEEKRAVKKVGIQQLCSWGILTEQNKELLPTNAFFLLQGTAFDMPEVQCAIFRGTTRSIFLDRQSFSGGLADQIEQAYQWVRAKLNVGADFNDVVRRDVYELPLWPVREVITNAVLHRSYMSSASVQVALYDDRLEISSPGGLPRGLNVAQVMSGRSEFRNKALAQAFRYMKLVEGWGSGVVRVMQDTVNYGLKTPEFVDLDATVRVNFWRPSAEDFEAVLRGQVANTDGTQKTSDGTQKTSDRIQKTSDGTQKTSDGTQKTSDGIQISVAKNKQRNEEIVAYLKQQKQITVEALAAHLQVGSARARQITSELVEQGILIKHGNGRYTFYTLETTHN